MASAKLVSWLVAALFGGAIVGGLVWQHTRTTSLDPAAGRSSGANQKSGDPKTPENATGNSPTYKQLREGDVTILFPEHVAPGDPIKITIQFVPEKIRGNGPKVTLAGFASVRNSGNREVGFVEISDEKPKSDRQFIIEFPSETSAKAERGGKLALTLNLASEFESEGSESDLVSSLNFEVPITDFKR